MDRPQAQLSRAIPSLSTAGELSSPNSSWRRALKNTYNSPLSPTELQEVVELLRLGKVGLFPTDTVYGLGCVATSSASTLVIYRMKNRPIDKTLPLLIGGWDSFRRLAGKIRASHRKRLEALWPGALTVVVPASREAISLSYHCQRNGTLALRMPNHPQLRYVIEHLQSPIAATSANESGRMEALSLEMVPQAIRSRVDWAWRETIHNGEPIPSTVVDLTGKEPVVLRQGAIDF